MNVFNKTFSSMGTRFDLVLIDLDNQLAEQIYFDIFHCVNELHNKFNRFDPQSHLSFINQTAALKEIQIDDDLFEIVSESIYYNKLTCGYFDITISPLIDLWHIEHGRKIDDFVPSENVILAAIQKTGTHFIKIDWEKKTIKFENPDLQLDLGAIAKGFALQKVNQLLDKYNITNSFISFGESSVLGKGHHPFGNAWKTGICNLFNPSETLYTFDLKDQSLSTSGTNINNVNKLPSNFSHILNPITGNPVKSIKTISVVSNSPIEAEILSTSLLAANKDSQMQILQNFKDVKVVEIEYDRVSFKPEVKELNSIS